MKRPKVASVIAALLAVALLVPATSAKASESAIAGAEASVDGMFVDAWQLVGNTVNLLLGDTSCTITASSPVQDANLVAGSGSVSCTRPFAKLTLTVCIQAKQPFVNESTTWEDIGCAPTKAQINSASLSETAKAACLAAPMLYRTHVTAEGFRADSGDPAYSAMIQSAQKLIDCGVV